MLVCIHAMLYCVSLIEKILVNKIQFLFCLVNVYCICFNIVISIRVPMHYVPVLTNKVYTVSVNIKIKTTSDRKSVV